MKTSKERYRYGIRGEGKVKKERSVESEGTVEKGRKKGRKESKGSAVLNSVLILHGITLREISMRDAAVITSPHHLGMETRKEKKGVARGERR